MLIIFIPLLITGGKVFAGFMLLLALAGMYELLKIKESERKIAFIMKLFA